MSAFFPPGDGWFPGPLFPPDLVRGPIETLRHTVAQIGAEDVERVWHRPIPPLPTRPGFYVAEAGSPGAHTVVELLAVPAGQWVDAGDRNYLDPDDVRALGPLIRLEPVREQTEQGGNR